MSNSVWSKLFVTVTACSVALALLIGAPRLGAQEKKTEVKPAAEKPAADKAVEKKPGETKEKAKPKGILPNFYGDVVSPEQREKIYAIQAKYADELAQLQEQIKAVTTKRNAEVEAILTPEQKDKVAKAAAESKAKAAKAAEEKKKAEAALVPLPGAPKAVTAPGVSPAPGTTPAKEPKK